ncbi:hypothetical protein G5C60_35870 [Streptomyces sp. HC44]|uniref:Uncharacterized protein n=1 Tax=Streptomyces scabichelini TaxID=2711217 RepID=A0A6G4VFU8_9ACTN|nr:hypothetical protein [Streptomyces scabichelini]NGO12841.1 hypothetical protein [Streptomyces scabichelini]
MLEEALMTLSATGGLAVVQAAGTDAWSGFRQAAARWFGRGDAGEEDTALARLDATDAAVRSAGSGEVTHRRRELAAEWQARFLNLLEELPLPERERAGEELQRILDSHLRDFPGSVTAGQRGVAAGRDISISAEGGSLAAAEVHGNVNFNPPPPAGPNRG